MFDFDSDIAALSSAPGGGGRAVLRLSGPRALELGAMVFKPEISPQLSHVKGFRRVAGVAGVAAVRLPACGYVFRGPRSYTRQDLFELHLPGSPAAAALLLEAVVAAGARQAGPGEFTLRALLSGRLDLARAEAVADVIAAENAAQLRGAQANAAGRLSGLCGDWSRRLTELLAEVEAGIDLAEEGLELLVPAAAVGLLTDLAAEMRRAVAGSTRPAAADSLPMVALTGRPNAGKSTLANALLGRRRWLTSPVAGATRDAAAAPWTLPGGDAVLLADSAGLDAETDHSVGGESGLAARAAALGRLGAAAAVVIVCDASAAAAEIRRQLGEALDRLDALRGGAGGGWYGGCRGGVLALLNKRDLVADLGALDAVAAALADEFGVEIASFSALHPEGLDALAGRIERLIHDAAESPADALALHARQAEEILAAAAIAVEWAARLVEVEAVSEVGELLSCDLREALRRLGLIQGHAAGEEVLGIIFSRFCVGK